MSPGSDPKLIDYGAHRLVPSFSGTCHECKLPIDGPAHCSPADNHYHPECCRWCEWIALICEAEEAARVASS